MPRPTQKQRNITRCLVLAEQLKASFQPQDEELVLFDELIHRLKHLDGRTGKNETDDRDT